MIKLFVSDIDSTLFDPISGVVPKINVQALTELQQSGVTLALASGRLMRGTLEIARMLHMDEYGGYIISSNGASVINLATQTSIVDKKLNVNELRSLYNDAKRLHLNFSVDQGEDVIASGFDDALSYDRDIVGLTFKLPNVDLDPYIMIPSHKCAVTKNSADPDITMNEMVELWQDRFSIVRSHENFLDIMAHDVSKSTGIQSLFEGLQLDYSEVAAIGDAENDRWMLMHAGLSACVANGSDSIKKLVDRTVASAADGGVAEFAYDIIEMNKKR